MRNSPVQPFLRIALLTLGLATGVLASAAAQAEEESFSQAELEQILAPIALYPDTVLSHILIAATYPLDVVQAERWVKENRDLTGEEAVAAVENTSWDPSVKALVAFPRIIVRMSENLEWTQRLGQAFLADESAVLASIQALRERAYAAGSLDSLDHLTVERAADTIVIEPAVHKVVYIPYYDTRVVYGDWHWHNHPPVYWSHVHGPHHRGPHHDDSHFYWSTGVRVHPAFFFSAFHWDHYNVVVIDNHHWSHNRRYHTGREIRRHRDARPWQHNPQHAPHYDRLRTERARLERRQDDWRQQSVERKRHIGVADRPVIHRSLRPAARPDWTDSRRNFRDDRASGRSLRSIQTGEPRHHIRQDRRQRMLPSHRARSLQRGTSPSQRSLRTMR